MVGIANGTLAKLVLVTTVPCVPVPVMPIGVGDSRPREYVDQISGVFSETLGG
jgi:hypothetical protein